MEILAQMDKLYEIFGRAFSIFFLMSILLGNNSSQLRSFINESRTERMPATTESLIF